MKTRSHPQPSHDNARPLVARVRPGRYPLHRRDGRVAQRTAEREAQLKDRIVQAATMIRSAAR